MNSRSIGGGLLLVGVVTGAGLITLPAVCAALSLFQASLLLVFAWSVMTLSALFVWRQTLFFPVNKNSLASMVGHTFGRKGKIFYHAANSLLLYILIAAYITGASDSLQSKIHLYSNIFFPLSLAKIVITVILGAWITGGARKIDYANRFILAGKFIVFLILIGLMVPHISLTESEFFKQSGKGSILIALPVLFVVFGLHPTIPSVVSYAGKDRSLWKVIFLSTTFPLILYLLWIFSANSIVRTIDLHSNLNYQDVLSALGKNRGRVLVSSFVDLALVSSILAVGLGLYDSWYEFWVFGRTRCQQEILAKILAGLGSFFPPLILTLIWPKGFLALLSVAALIASVTVIIIPALLFLFTLKKTGRMNYYLGIAAGIYTILGGLLLGGVVLAVYC